MFSVTRRAGDLGDFTISREGNDNEKDTIL